MEKFTKKNQIPALFFFFLFLAGALILLSLIFFESAAAGQELGNETAAFRKEEEEYYELTADNIVYDRQHGVLEAADNVVFETLDYRFEADRLIFYINDNLVEASGDPLRLLTADEKIIGKELSFNYQTGEGEFVQAETRVDEITFSGNRLTTVSENGLTLQVEEALYTPCLLPEPHYSIRAGRVTVYPDDRVVAEEAAFYWGETRIIALPYYVLEFTEDPDDPEHMILQDTTFIYEIGYDSIEGIILGLGYLYEIGDRTEGSLLYSRTLAGTEIREADNILRISDNLVLETEYDFIRYQEDFFQEVLENRESHRWQENFETVLTFTPTHHTIIKAGYSYQDLEGELEQVYFSGWEHRPFPGLTVRQQQRVIQEWQESEEGEEQENERKERRPLTTSLDYEQRGRNIRLDLKYDFLQQSWRQEYYHREVLGREDARAENLAFSFYHDYHDWRLDRRDYQLELDNSGVFWQLRYREGYDTEFLPYSNLELPIVNNSRFGSLKLEAGLGRLVEKGRETDRFKVSPLWQQSLSDLRGWELDAESRFTYIYHLAPGAVANFIALENELALERVFWEQNFSWNSKQNWFFLKMPGELSLQQRGGLEIESNYSRGESYLVGDKVESRLKINPHSSIDLTGETGFETGIRGELVYDLLEREWLRTRIGFRFKSPTAAPQSSLAFDFAGDYDNSQETWQKLDFQLERKLDCYSYSLNYEAVDQAFFLGFDLDL